MNNSSLVYLTFLICVIAFWSSFLVVNRIPNFKELSEKEILIHSLKQQLFDVRSELETCKDTNIASFQYNEQLEDAFIASGVTYTVNTVYRTVNNVKQCDKNIVVIGDYYAHNEYNNYINLE